MEYMTWSNWQPLVAPGYNLRLASCCLERANDALTGILVNQSSITESSFNRECCDCSAEQSQVLSARHHGYLLFAPTPSIHRACTATVPASMPEAGTMQSEACKS